MKKNKNKFNEEALRKRIREELEKKHHNRENKVKKKDIDLIKYHTTQEDEERSLFMERYIKQEVENDVYSKHPEFVKCANHLDEIHWLTPVELDDEFEYYPIGESIFKRFRKKLFKKKFSNIPDTPEIRKMIEDYYKEIEADAKQRIEHFNQKRKEAEKRSLDETETNIYEEEMDRFYRSKRGYKKYENHLNETRWMTKEEMENQDEFLEEVIPKWKIVLKRAFVTTGILLVVALIWFFRNLSIEDEQKAFLIVKLSEDRGHVYIDKNLAVGLSANVPYPLKPGEHEISLIRSGYIATPKLHKIDVNAEDTIHIAFDLTAQLPEETGLVRINALYGDARIFADGEFHGTLAQNTFLILPAGDHTLSLEKEEYSSAPRQHVFKLDAGDTIDISFNMRRIKSGKKTGSSSGLVDVGLIEVRSNIKNADIFLDGQKTSFKTDYVLQKIPFGQHILSVSKKGYKIYPEERAVRLNKKQKHASIDFTLTSASKHITINTLPVKGAIYINGKRIGDGSVKATLPLGKHTISFGNVDYYEKPKEQIITITEDGSSYFNFNYASNFYIEFTPGGVLPSSNLGYISSGHILEGVKFKQSKQNGPETKFEQIVNGNIWELGYAFQYRNPPGCDAIAINFNIPKNFDLSGKIKLKIWCYKTKSNYPLAIKGNSYYQVIINNYKFRKEVLPKNSKENMSKSRYDEFVVNEYLKVGFNRIIIATTESTSAHLALWKIAVE
jgi:hypothetical protein